MISFSKIDMSEVTRLTREGRLKEAMTLLRGQSRETGRGRSTGEGDHAKDKAKDRAFVDLKRSGDKWFMPKRSGSGTKNAGDREPGSERAGPASPGARGARAPFREELRRTVPPGTRAKDRSSAPEPADSTFLEESFECEAGQRPYKLFVPSGYDEKGRAFPLVVMLHGCTQSPDDFAAGTRMNELAEEKGFLVLYPEQIKSANMSKCWNWFEMKDQQREGGEPEILASMVRGVMADYRVDTKRVFAAGLSAGGAAAAILGQRYPDLFTAIGVHSGLACGAASGMGSAFSAMQGMGSGGADRGHPISAIIFQGTKDRTVSPKNAAAVGDQAKGGLIMRASTKTGRSDGGKTYTQTIMKSETGASGQTPITIEDWSIEGLGHAWSGGSASGSYTDPSGPDASREMLRFFESVAAAS